MKSEFKGVIFTKLSKFEDDRGWLFELFRNDELAPKHHPAMSYASWTRPGVSRGPHEHHDQTDLFCFVGPGDFQLCLWQAKNPSWNHEENPLKPETFIVGESNPMAVLIPPGVVHAYKNVSDYTGMVFNSPNELYGGVGKRYEVDEIRHEENEKYTHYLN